MGKGKAVLHEASSQASSQAAPGAEKWVLVGNAVAATVSAVSCVVAMADPGVLLQGDTPGGGIELYVQAYAVRQLPLTAAVLASLTARYRRHLMPVLVVSGIAQVGDALIGATSGIPGMAVGGTVAAALHLASAAWLGKRRTPAALPA
ncbi:hypothetical protein GCM10011579_069980 [Streptomyces albiflavescens]|uniref:Uncharacterized protein n=1 Tax=Streptomyces albiflavescens TaxID=1623582 RepID=A0A917YB98_9ACTN|nr:hypothetical protein [Streptomyces albiflavescens]GGN82417.1 hypothetical protein GCM10011579_069980 [Streptomyces albiflavescens]